MRLLAGVLWGITMMSMAWLTFLVGMAALWGAAASAPMGGFLLDCLLGVAGAAAVLGVVAFAPGVRRMEVPHRMLLLGVMACPVPAVLAVSQLAQQSPGLECGNGLLAASQVGQDQQGLPVRSEPAPPGSAFTA